MSRDGFEIAKSEALRDAHAQIDALLEEVAGAQPPGVYSMNLKVDGFAKGRAILDGSERAEICAAALLRYTAMKRNYTGGTYSPGSFTIHDYQEVVSRLAQALLRSKLPFEAALLVRVVTEVEDYAAENVRSFPIKGLLSQVEHLAKKALPPAMRPPLEALAARLAKDVARYKTTPAPAVVRDAASRVAKLLAKK